MITPQDLQKWQQASGGVDKLLNEFSPEELQAYQKLSELFKNENFQTSESAEYVQTLKNVTLKTKNRLFKAYLTNIVALSENYFTAKKTATNTPPPQPTPVIETPPIIPPVFETPKVEPKVKAQKNNPKPKSKWQTILIVIIALLLIGGYLAYKYWDTISEKFFTKETENVSSADVSDELSEDEIIVEDDDIDSLNVTKIAEIETIPEKIENTPVVEITTNPQPPNASNYTSSKKKLTDSEIISLFSDVSIGDNEAYERFLEEVGRNIRVEGVENIDNSYELAHDAFLYDRYYTISIQRNSNGKISKIVVQ